MHPLLPVALDCLKDHDTNRPTSQELCQTFHSIKLSPDYQGSVQQSKDQTIHMYNQKTKIEKLSEEVNGLTQENEARTRQLRELNEQLQLNEQVIAQQQQEIGRKDRELAAQLQHMMNQQQTEVSEVSTQQVENIDTTEGEIIDLTLDSSIAIPEKVSHVVPAVIGDMVYIVSENRPFILEYDTRKKLWSVIKNHPILRGEFSLVNINNVLTTVGGAGKLFHSSNKLYCYIPTLKTWVEIFPPMPFRHRRPVVVCNQNHLVVISAVTDRDTLVQINSKAVVMKTDTHEWFEVELTRFTDPRKPTLADTWNTPIYTVYPNNGYTITSAVLCQDRVYIYANLHETIGEKDAIEAIYLLPNCNQTKKLTRVGVMSYSSTSKIIDGVTLWYKNTKLISKTEQVIGEMSVARSKCLAAILPHNKVMVIGFENDGKCSADIFTTVRR